MIILCRGGGGGGLINVTTLIRIASDQFVLGLCLLQPLTALSMHHQVAENAGITAL